MIQDLAIEACYDKPLTSACSTSAMTWTNPP